MGTSQSLIPLLLLVQALSLVGIGCSILIAVKRWIKRGVSLHNMEPSCNPLYTSKGPVLVQMAMTIAGYGVPKKEIPMTFARKNVNGAAVVYSMATRLVYCLSHVDNVDNEADKHGLLPFGDVGALSFDLMSYAYDCL